MKDELLEQLIKDAFSEEEIPSRILIAKTKKELGKSRAASFTIGAAAVVNSLTFTALLCLLVISNYNPAVKILGYTFLSTTLNSVFILIYVYKDRAKNIFMNPR